MPPVMPDEVVAFASAALETAGVPRGDASLVADSLVTADLWGHQSHGVLRLRWYWDRLRAGVMEAVTRPEIVIDRGAVAVIDGHDGIGQVLAARAIELGIARAKAHGIAAVGVRNSNHFGTAAYFTRAAPPRGCVAILTTNASPAMAPWGGREKRVGNNPWSIAAPAGRRGTAVMDLANTAVARGKLYLARQRGERIPEDWAMSADGRRTTDPSEGIDGMLLPMGGHKGYVIALMLDVLAGVLTGSGFGTDVVGPYRSDRRSGCGHLAIVLDTEAFLAPDELASRMDRLLDEVTSTPPAPGFDRVLYPGELEARAEATARREGIALPAATLADLAALAHDARVELPAWLQASSS
ncbi:MAG TPA: Ldh family oxidoreductase [Candidatus Limnocylindria bacterium]|nr:Ldh family oxidoreductase [Candidatus Limnocylindria bacterium]